MPHPASNPPPSIAVQKCTDAACGAEFPVASVLTACPACTQAGRGESLLDVVYDWDAIRNGALGEKVPPDFAWFSRPGSGADRSGVWQFKELLPFYRSPADIASVGEGRTILQKADALGTLLGFRGRTPSGAPSFHLQYEGFNPSGSFKDNGMSAGFTHARIAGAKVVACASTGNTSASLALYAAQTGLRAYVFVGDGKIAFGKLSQALDYGATTLQVAGDFDRCLCRVREIAEGNGSGVYLLNSVNPFRLEGQKTIMCRVLRDLGVGRGGRVPDWIVVPGGNLGNCSAFAKAFAELKALGMIDRLPRLAVINATGARTFDRIVNELGVRWTPTNPERQRRAVERGTPERPGPPSHPGAERPVADAPGSLQGTCPRDIVAAEWSRMDRERDHARTIASAIEINRPVNLPKALRALALMDGVVRSVDDDDILEHKALVGRHGLGCEPASAASVAGARLLLAEGVIRPDETVVCVLTGHQLKDPDATVGYHTGLDTKAPAQASARPSGLYANPPIRVPDDTTAILAAMGLA